MKIGFLALFAVLSQSTLCLAAPHLGRAIDPNLAPAPSAEMAKILEKATQELYFTQRLDHADASDSQTFQQRYYVNSYYAKDKNSPVLLMICGEGPCEKGDLLGAVDFYGKRFKAHLVAMEHRYYGKSQPFQELTTENLRFLSTDEAIADLSNFRQMMIEKYGFNGKWISIGGSYSGNLSAFLRLKHPDGIVGSLASSAPVHATLNFEAYDKHVFDTLPADCAQQVQKMIPLFDNALKSPAQMARIRDLFSAQKVIADEDVIDLAEGAVDMEVQYGNQKRFCAAILGKNSLTGWAGIAQTEFKEWGMSVVDMSTQSIGELHSAANGYEQRQWAYQTCTEYGYFQTAYHDPKFSVSSPRNTLDYQLNVCKKYFGINTLPAIEKLNARYYERLLAPSTSSILFTNSEGDPWSELSITPANGNAINPYLDTAEYSGLGHCGDMGSSTLGQPASVHQARELFIELAQKWLE